MICAVHGLAPLGATRIEEEHAFNFALYSKHAESVGRLPYTPDGIIRRGSMPGFRNAAISAGQAIGCAAGAAGFMTPALGAAVLAAGAPLRAQARRACDVRRGSNKDPQGTIHEADH